MDKKDYLDISNARDIKDKRQRRIYRFLEMLPGIISFGTLIGVLVFSWLIPAWVAIFMIAFCFYYLFRIFYFSLHQIVGYARVKSHMKRDWLQELKGIKDKNWKDIYHVVILPTYREGEMIIRESIESLAHCEYPKERIIIILSVEERAGRHYQDIANRLAREYATTFFKFIAVVHPGNIPGEIAGKGSNVAFAGKEAQKLVDSLALSYENVLISNFDIDTKIYPQYFSCLTWYYLTQPDPMRASYQPVPVYNNNIWKATFFARVVASSNTFWQMIQQERSEKLTTYSSHAMPAKAFFEIGYPHNVVCDDSRIFWRAYLNYDGDYRVVPMYYLLSMDAVDAHNSFKTIVNQYKQQKRWAWGCAEIPYIMFGFLHNKNIPLFKKISHVYTLLMDTGLGQPPLYYYLPWDGCRFF
jgi:hypothetical protein